MRASAAFTKPYRSGRAAANSVTPRRTARIRAPQRSLRSTPIGRARVAEHEQREDRRRPAIATVVFGGLDRSASRLLGEVTLICVATLWREHRVRRGRARLDVARDVAEVDVHRQRLAPRR